MAARKLATEIERTLKKVSEGVEIFEGIFDKIQLSTNQAQKEKLESDLKSQIKKLQRLRDQIKTWMQSNDIKDKAPLVENRKLIETQMERFKACEKEMKTKAFSKEGLNAQAKLDPKEQQKLELCNWITTMVDELARQVEQTEAEIETLQLQKKKKDSERGQRLDELEALNERRLWHVTKLELILRLLENGNLQTDSVLDVKDDIAYFVESNTEEDFEEDEGIYDDLNLEEEEELFGQNGDDIQSSHDSVSVADESAPSASIPPTPNLPASTLPTSQPPRTPAKEASLPSEDASEKSPPPPAPKPKATPVRKATLDSTTPRPPVSTPTRSVSQPGPVPRTVPTPLPPIRYAAAAAAANVPMTPSTPASSAPTPSTPASVPASTPAPTTAPPPGIFKNPSRQASVASASAASSPEVSKAVPPEPSPALPALAAASASASLSQPSPTLSSASGNYPHSSGGPSQTPSVAGSQPITASPVSSSQNVPSAADSASPAPAEEEVPPASEKPLATTSDRPANEPRLPSSLADLVTSFESAKQKSMKRDNDLGSIHEILDAGFSNVPQPLDAEKPKYYVPRNPFNTPSYYPHEPSGQFANPALFSKFDVDTLFYIFYYCQGTYLQYLAAAELKKQSWRFHKQYLTWFQRANEPQQITDEFEQGVYIYWDWEGSWCQRRKSDFRFEYRYLSPD